MLRALLAARSPGAAPTESALETRLARVLREAGLPAPERQFEMISQGRVIRLDFAFPTQRLAVETDGARYHLNASAWERDPARRAALAELGWRCLVIT
ncbi:MAG TPA: DUF559 domain-containing protein [Myxococcaceae bacterium]|nr:DUF559 domain-containing protein [Myxococcaceae bacterium]